MLTDDGKHLYVSWDEYHLLTERLALKVHASGWEFDQILCLARGGMRPGDVLSRVFDKPLAIMSTSSYRADAGTIQGRLDLAKYITMPKGELAGRVLLVDDLADTGITLRAVVERLRGMPVDRRVARRGDLGQRRVVATRRTTTSRSWKPARGSTNRSRNMTACGPMGWRRSSLFDALANFSTAPAPKPRRAREEDRSRPRPRPGLQAGPRVLAHSRGACFCAHGRHLVRPSYCAARPVTFRPRPGLQPGLSSPRHSTQCVLSVRQKQKADTCVSAFIFWCPEEDSNLHAVKR